LGKGDRDVLEGEEDWLFPNRAGIMMKYFDELRVLEEPMSHSLSEITVLRSQSLVRLCDRAISRGCLHPLYQVGYIIAGFETSPKVLYAIFADGMVSPDLRVKSPRS
jgi:hypothetical protein